MIYIYNYIPQPKMHCKDFFFCAHKIMSSFMDVILTVLATTTTTEATTTTPTTTSTTQGNVY